MCAFLTAKRSLDSLLLERVSTSRQSLRRCGDVPRLIANDNFTRPNSGMLGASVGSLGSLRNKLIGVGRMN